MKSMEFVTDDIMRAAIDAMAGEFDSEEWIAEIRRTAEHAYVRELHKKLDLASPIQQTHADMASHLSHPPFTTIVVKTGDHPGTSIKGTPTSVATWKKL